MSSSLIAPAAFTVTQAGIDASVLAGQQGMTIQLTRFKLGTGVGYTPELGDTGLKGADVFSAAPSAWNMLTDTNARDVVCVVPANAGPFTFGEIGLYLEDGTLFALAAFKTLQTKSSSASGIANSLTFHCVLNLGIAPSVIQIIAGTAGVVAEVGNTAFVTGPVLMPGKPNALIVAEAVNGNNSLFMTAANEHQWNVQNYLQVSSGPITAISANGLTLTSTALNIVDDINLPGDFLVQDLVGNVRSITSGAPGEAIISYSMGGLKVGDVIILLARATSLSDFINMQLLIAQQDADMTQALNDAIEGLTGVLDGAITAVRADMAALGATASGEASNTTTTVNNSLTALDTRLTARMTSLETTVNSRLATMQTSINTSVTTLTSSVDSKIAAVNARIDALSGATSSSGAAVSSDVAATNATVAALTTTVNNMKSELISMMLGVGQTWKNVTSQRAFLTDYTNNSTRPIMVAVGAYTQGYGASGLEAFVNGVQVSFTVQMSQNTGFQPVIEFIVPPGGVYRAQGTIQGNQLGISRWAELS